MGRQRNIFIGYAIAVLIVATANIMNPRPFYWIAWAILAILGVLNIISYRRSVKK